jgi:hypothetical protein
MPKCRYVRRPRVWQTGEVLTHLSRNFTASGNILSKGVDSRERHSETSPIKMDAQKFVEKSLAMEESTTLDDEALLHQEKPDLIIGS